MARQENRKLESTKFFSFVPCALRLEPFFHFDIRHSLFDIRYSLFPLAPFGSSLPAFFLHFLNAIQF
jgi:hypothetical protein